MRNTPDRARGLTAILCLMLSANILSAAERVVVCEDIYSET
jgi:hypothetical protein